MFTDISSDKDSKTSTSVREPKISRSMGAGLKQTRPRASPSATDHQWLGAFTDDGEVGTHDVTMMDEQCSLSFITDYINGPTITPALLLIQHASLRESSFSADL